MLLYRSAAWFAKELREYTKSGYESASKDFVPDDLEVQVLGRAFLVTRGNSGIGKATAMEISKRGGTVYLVCRDQNRVEDARDCGLVRFQDLRKFVENFKWEHTLNVLVTVSSGGMSVQKLNTNDLQSESSAFDGTTVYAQSRKPVPTHLPLARTSSTLAEEEKLIEILEELAQRFK